jgi:hypothetical protein
MVYVNRRLLGQQRDKLFREALRMQLAQAGENLKALREIADVLIAEAKAGNIRAIQEIADRLDGKPAPQMHELGNDGTAQIHRKITYTIVHETREELEARDQEERQRQLEAEDVDYREVKAVNGNGHDHAESEGDEHERRE